MSAGPISGFSNLTPSPLRPDLGQQGIGQTGISQPGPSFTDRIGGAINDLAESQETAATSAKNFELGVETDLASVMIDQQISSLGFQFALNVRNKALSAYRDIMNMPV